MSEQKIRYQSLDVLRGICLISMILYHTVWDLVYIYGFDWEWYRSVPANIWQQSICWGFIMLSGFCIPFGKKVLRRGMVVFGAGCIITIVTLIVMPDQPIIFGVLTLIGSSMLIVGAADKFVRKFINAEYGIAGMIVSFLMFAFTYSANKGFVGFFTLRLIDLPEFLYKNYFTTFWGFRHREFFSTDYFSVFPWIFLFLTGYFANFVVMKSEKCAGLRSLLEKGHNGVCAWLGRHSLLIYMLHQPVVYGILYIMLHKIP